ncbi:MAG: DNA polymerase I [Planctomycetota bacterium]|nr:DNA polymerase I [Planctomycetota bacterium]
MSAPSTPEKAQVPAVADDATPTKRERIFLLDGTALAFRSHFAFARSGLTSTDGKPTGATLGFTMVLRKLLAKEKPDRIACCFDTGHPTFRHKQFKEYKATREKAPEDLVAQFDLIREVTRAHGIPIFEVPGFEADDVLGTLSTQAEAAGLEVQIVTGDKDLMQLVSPTCVLYNVFKRGVDLVIEDEAAVMEKFGTTPDHVIDVLAIMGDSSDNIPGVKGIGIVGAKKLIAEFGSVPNLLENLDQVKGKNKEKIETDREMLELSLDLVTIDKEVPLDPGFEVIGPAEPNDQELLELFHRLDFQSLAKDIAAKTAGPAGEASPAAIPQDSVERVYKIIETEDELDELIATLEKAGRFSIDTETTSIFAMQAELVGISFSTELGKAWYVPANNFPPLCGGTPGLLKRLENVLTSPDYFRVAQNAKYDWQVFDNQPNADGGRGIPIPPANFDTMLGSFCVAGATRRHNLDALALHYFQMTKIPTSQIIGKGKKQITMDKVPIEEVGEYACEDADVTWRLFEKIDAELDDETNNPAGEVPTRELFETVEMPLVPVLTAMEKRGITLDVNILEGMRGDLEEGIQEAEYRVHELAGENFKVSSPKALGDVLFNKLRIQDAAGVKRPKKTKTGFSTDHATLSEKYPGVEICEKVLEFRELTKLKNTYVDALPKFVNPRTGRVHCSYSQVSAATGRLASNDPNLQNIPIRTKRGRQLRKAFVPPEPDEHGDWILMAADYSQVELRVMAHLSGDEAMCQAFREDFDIHTATASLVFGVGTNEIDRAMRSKAKVINFGLLYGMGPQRLARETDMTVPEAIEFTERYFNSFPRVREWIDSTLEGARETGYVSTLLGRRRPINDINADNARMRSFAENAAVNTPVQGSAADIIKRAMIDTEAAIQESGLHARMLLQVHDELVFELPASQLEETVKLVTGTMENAVELDVPLKVDCGHGKNWLEAH